LIAAKIEDVAIPGYDFLNHCGPRDFIHRLWQQLFLKTVQANAQILRGKLWRGLAQRASAHSHFFHLKII
jgi:hypothetical protein